MPSYQRYQPKARSSGENLLTVGYTPWPGIFLALPKTTITMGPKNPLLFLSLSLSIGLAPFLSAQSTPQSTVETLQEMLRPFIATTNWTAEQFQITGSADPGWEVSGTVSLLGVQGVQLQAQLGKSQQLRLHFPNGAGSAFTWAGQSLSDLLPTLLRGKMDLRTLRLATVSGNASTITWEASFGPTGGEPALRWPQFTLQDVLLTLSGSSQSSRDLAAAVQGQFLLGQLPFALGGAVDAQRNWTLSAEVGALRAGELFNALRQGTGLNLPPAPDFFDQIALQSARWDLGNGGALSFKASSTLGQMEALLQPASAGQAAGFFLAMAPPSNFRLAQWSSALQPLDQVGLQEMACIYASSGLASAPQLELLAPLQLGNIALKPGLTLLGGFQLPEGLPGVQTRGRVLLRAQLPAGLSVAPTLMASVQFNGLQLGEAFRINEAFLQLAPVDMSFGAGLSLGANFDGKNWLNFSGLGEIAPPATFGLVVFMEDGSVWKNPFGLPGLEISQLGLDVGADVLSPLPRPKLGLRGAIKIGPFSGAASGMINTANPLESLISLQMNELSLQTLANAFLSPRMKAEWQKLPANWRETGLRNAELTIIPKPLTMAGRSYSPGLRIRGQSQLFGLAGRLDLNATYDNGLAGVLAIAPIRLVEGSTTLFQLSGGAAADSLRVATDLTYSNLINAQQPFLFVDGQMQLLGISSRTKVEIGRAGFYLATTGSLFGKFQASLDARGGNIFQSQQFQVRAAMRNDLFSYLNREMANAIDIATRSSQSAYRKAKEDLRSAEDYLRNSQGAVDAFNRQKAKVDAAQADVDRLGRDVASAKRSCDRAPWYRKADRCAKYAALKASKETADGVLSGYKKTLDGLSKAVDWTQRNAMTALLAAARETISGFEQATTGSMKAAKWIVDQGLTGLVDVKSAEFEGQLNGIQGGKVTLAINTQFLRQDFNGRVSFNFFDPIGGAKEMAQLLLDDRAPKGRTPELGTQIGKGYQRP